jgi:hypothetical protein
MKALFLLVLPLSVIVASCKKNKNTPPEVLTPVPFITGKKWTVDTVTINAPAAYNQLNADEQLAYRNLLLWWGKKAQITFNENGSVTSEGGYDLGYYKWRMINTGKDIEVLISNGGRKDTLFKWTANSQQFTYQMFNPSYTSTVIWK